MAFVFIRKILPNLAFLHNIEIEKKNRKRSIYFEQILHKFLSIDVFCNLRSLKVFFEYFHIKKKSVAFQEPALHNKKYNN